MRASHAFRFNAGLILLGLSVACLWLYLSDGPQFFSKLTQIEGFAVLPLLGATGLCVFIRFVRWQYLLRSVGIRIPARGGLSVFLASLAGIATPAYVGEIARSFFLRRRYGAPVSTTALVLVVERLLDVATLGFVAMLTANSRQMASLMVVAVAIAVFGLVALRVLIGFQFSSRIPRKLGSASVLLPAFALSLVAWAPSALLYSLAALALGNTLPLLASTHVFTASSVVGAVSLMPAGIGSAGSLAILQLQNLDFTLADSVLTVSVVRLFSTGVSIAVGAIFLMRQLRAPQRANEQSAAHFDDIASEYLDQFPSHIWKLLLERRRRLLAEKLADSRASSKLVGLDLGCGLGQQSLAVGRLGHQVIGIDAAHDLVCRATDSGVSAATADLRSLPFADDTFDFVYTIGVLHHLPGVAEQTVAAREAARVLKPGGLFLVQETNPRNPLFRFYMGYVFPILRSIDEGTESWIDPRRWSDTDIFSLTSTHYFSFIPDFAPSILLHPLLRLERLLESSFLRPYSVHYMATLRKEH